MYLVAILDWYSHYMLAFALSNPLDTALHPQRAVGHRAVDSIAVPWDAVVEAAPEVLVLACCGYSVERTLADLPLLRSYPGFDWPPAAERGEVYLVDGSAYFSRPGPRIVDSLEILAAILHPELFHGPFPDRSVTGVG